jgi:outer membrane protein OmpA-like peptidoglycan-associated protein
MRIQLMPAAVAVLLAASPALPVAAQSNPSADQIVNGLKLTPDMLKGPTRGIRPIGPTQVPGSSATPAAAHVAAPHATPPAANPSVSLQVEFRSGSADLTPEAMRTLDELGRALTNPALAGNRFRIEGHTDTVGTPDMNQALSERRAQTVAAYLESKFGVDSSRLEPAGLGEDGLLVKTPPQTPEARNRRVQVVNLGA